ncbi:M15 family metallopeptidase, partial [Sphingomonas sp.]|uniref:M15 family metallopeptidase n=1 Tax=Sphingomonas sp. TaxID=28214 RepID=UPI001DE8B833
RPEVAADLKRLLTAADLVPEVKGRIRAVSCYRTVTHQRRVFCGKIGPGRAARTPADRARFVGPPGYSEHATGYAIDFATRPSPGCADVNACFARTAAGRWLIQHAGEFGFELSFPAGNGQGVSYEPWHWRWVGTSATAPGAAAARAIFARARASYPAQPMVIDNPARMLMPTPGFQTLPR